MFDPLPELAMSKYNMKFQKSLYDVRLLSSSKNLSGFDHIFGFPGARDIVATMEIRFNGTEGGYVQYFLNQGGRGCKSVRAVWLEPGLNKIELMLRTLPKSIHFMSRKEQGEVSLISVELGFFKYRKYRVFQSTAAGCFILKLIEPFIDEKLLPSAELMATRNLIKSPAHPHLPFFYLVSPKKPGPTLHRYPLGKS